MIAKVQLSMQIGNYNIRHVLISSTVTQYTGKNHEKISGKLCIFPQISLFLSQNGQIIRPFWERKGKL